MKFLKNLLLFLLCIGLIILIWTMYHFRDRHPDFSINRTIPAGEAQQLYAGFSAVPITPSVPDTWTDVNNDGQFIKSDGDHYVDGNDNGQFDPIWLAGFQNQRPASGIHDELWARAVVIDDGHFRLALVAVDAIGLMADDIITVRQQIKQNTDVDYTIVTSTHTHAAPDLIGLWGGSNYRSGVSDAYLNKVKQGIYQAVSLADTDKKAVTIRFAQDTVNAVALVDDTRKPRVLDAGLRLMQFIDQGSQKTLGTLIAWANHPETLWTKNTMVTSDFPHYVRKGIEEGISRDSQLVENGLGGISIYINGAIGGLMTTHPNQGIKDLLSGKTIKTPSFEKAKTQGTRLASLALKALQQKTDTLTRGSIALRAKTIELPLDNSLYRIAAGIGLIDRGQSSWLKVRTEVAYWTLGPASFLHLPGEVYPEIINGGVVSPPGADFPGAIIEDQPLRDLMKGDYRFVVGLSNDMIGYIIPKSEWDDQAPFLYDAKEETYGEINSVGPETSGILYRTCREMMKE